MESIELITICILVLYDIFTKSEGFGIDLLHALQARSSSRDGIVHRSLLFPLLPDLLPPPGHSSHPLYLLIHSHSHSRQYFCLTHSTSFRPTKEHNRVDAKCKRRALADVALRHSIPPSPFCIKSFLLVSI